MKCLFAGGGSLGPVTPLLAVWQCLRVRVPQIEGVWVGTPDGPEQSVVTASGMAFESLPVAKLARYATWSNITLPWRFAQACRRARAILRHHRPDIVVTVGGFTALPIALMAWTKRIPIVLHQLDREITLTNALIAPIAASCTTSFAYPKKPFLTRGRVDVAPTPTRFQRHHAPSRVEACEALGLDPRRPVTFIYGGGQGAQAINHAVWSMLDAYLEETQVIHVTGRGKMLEAPKNISSTQGYHLFEFLQAEEMLLAHSAADVEVIRAGMGALSEATALQKACVVVPLPDSHQERNVEPLRDHQAADVVFQSSVFDAELFQSVKHLLHDAPRRKGYAQRWHDALATDDGSAFAARILRVLK